MPNRRFPSLLHPLQKPSSSPRLPFRVLREKKRDGAIPWFIWSIGDTRSIDRSEGMAVGQAVVILLALRESYVHKRTRYYSPSLPLFRLFLLGGRNCFHFQTNLHFTNKITPFTKICLYIFLVSEDTSCLFLSSPLWFPVGSDWKRMQFSLDLNGRKKKVGDMATRRPRKNEGRKKGITRFRRSDRSFAWPENPPTIRSAAAKFFSAFKIDWGQS